MGIGKNRTFHTEAIEGLIRDTGQLMEAADKITKELYEEMRDIAAVLASLPADVRDQGLYEDVLRLRDSLRTDEFLAYRKEMSQKLERLLRDITQGDRREAAGLDAVAADVRSLTARIKDLSALIPEGADSGSYEDFRKKYEACVRAWDASDDALERLKQALKAALHGVHVKGVCMSGDPVNLSTGNFTYEKEDLRLPGNPPLIIRRSYNALSEEKGLLGQGWRFSWESCIRRMEEEAVLCAGDGHEERYERGRDGSFWGSGTRNRLTEGPEGYELTTPEGIRYRYDTEGKLTGWEEAFHGMVRLSYEGEKLCRIFRESDGAGYRLVYGTASDGEERLLEIREELPGDNEEEGITERTVSYAYGEGGRLETVTGADGNTLTYGYDAHGHLESITNAEGTVTVRNTYDGEGRCIRQEFPDGGAMEYAYEEAEACVILTERNGSRIRYYHDDRYHHTKTVYEDGEEQYAYNQRGQCIRHKDALGNITRYSYDVRGNLTQVIDALGGKSNAIYDGDGHLLKLKMDDKLPYSSHYDDKGRMTEISDATGRITRIRYEEDQRSIIVEQTDGTSFTIVYDERGNITALTDPYGAKTQYHYDIRGELTGKTYPDGSCESYRYDHSGNLYQITERSGQSITYQYDSQNRLTEKDCGNGRREVYRYNCMGDQIQRTDALGYVTSYEYDASGKMTKVTDALGNETCYTYDRMGGLVCVTRYEGTAGNGGKRETTVYERDLCGRVISVQDALGQKESYAYDAAGRMIRKIDPDGNETCYTYTSEGKLAEITYADGRKAEWRYDEKGNCTEMQDWRGVTRMEYDVMGRVIKVTDPDGREAAYGKGALGECSRLRYSNGREVVYRYNEMGGLTELILGECSICYHYDEAGRIAEKCLPNGICTSYKYDASGNMIQIRHEGKKFVEEYQYRFDTCGNKVQMKKMWKGETEGSETYDYAYDAMNRLTEVRKDQELIRSYAYDAFGNRIRKTVCQNGDRKKIAYSYNENNQLICEEENGREKSYQYDRAGNLTEVIENGMVIAKYAYDATGRMCSACRQEEGQIQKTVYLYNGWNQRVGQKIYEGSTPEKLSLEKEIRYDTDPARPYRNLMQAADETHGEEQAYIWDGGIAALSEGDRISYYLSDDLGSVRFLTDEKGNIRERYEYDEFGSPVREDCENADLMKQPFRYTGYQMDETTGLYYAHERSYDAAQGRFTGEDVLRGNMREPYTQNHYVYCWNRPLQYVDLDGREPKAASEAGINGGVSILADGTVADITGILHQPKTVSPGIGSEIKGAPLNTGLYQHQTGDCSRETAVPELPGFRDLLIHAGASAGGGWDADPKSWSWFQELVEMAGRNQDGAVTGGAGKVLDILETVRKTIEEENEKVKIVEDNYKTDNYYYLRNRDIVSEIKGIDSKYDTEIKHFQELYSKYKERYEELSDKTGVPAELIASIHYRECASDFDWREGTIHFSVYLHNGQELGKETTIVPKKIIFGEDQFDEAVVDALEGKPWNQIEDTEKEGFKSNNLEAYNVTGLRDGNDSVWYSVKI